MRHLPSRYRRLDGALAALPVEEPMLLTELDGFLTGILIAPEAIAVGEWMQSIWGLDDGGVAPFEDPLDVQWFADAVLARQAEIARDLARGRPQPIFHVDERNGETLWDGWILALADALDLRPDSWERLAGHGDARVRAAAASLQRLVAVADGSSEPDSMEINALDETAPADIADAVIAIYAGVRKWADVGAAPTASKIGRNDPCPCGSGKKSKLCCGNGREGTTAASPYQQR